MDLRLQKLIADYQAHVVQALELLESIGVSRPKTNFEWATTKVVLRSELPAGFSWCKHGYGLSVEQCAYLGVLLK